jgi:hypothetical protein
LTERLPLNSGNLTLKQGSRLRQGNRKAVGLAPWKSRRLKLFPAYNRKKNALHALTYSCFSRPGMVILQGGGIINDQTEPALSASFASMPVTHFSVNALITFVVNSIISGTLSVTIVIVTFNEEIGCAIVVL